MLSFLPSRLILLVLGFSFFWLPRVPPQREQEQNFTRATTVRRAMNGCWARCCNTRTPPDHHLFR